MNSDNSQGRVYRFMQVDVFTDRIFSGNPLAVFLDGRGLSDAEMQLITREMNLSETTFVLPPEQPGCDAWVRIFTPAHELPFAGHPTLGTSFVLATLGMLPQGASRITLQEGIGPVPVSLEGDPAAPSFIWMRHPDAIFGHIYDNREAFAGALGLAEGDLLSGAPVQVARTGLPFVYVPLVDRAAIDRCVVNVPVLIECFGETEPVGVFVLAPDGEPGANQVYSRMFAPHILDIAEDPATGGASGSLGAYLVKYGLAQVEEDGRALIVSEQGTKMGRQSFVHIRLRLDGKEAREIEVGGSIVSVFEGTLYIP